MTPHVVPGYVLIKPHDHNLSTKTVMIQDDFTPHYNFSVTGEVVSVSTPGDFYEAPRDVGHDAFEAYEHRKRIGISIQFDVPVEVMVGDTVVFPYFYHIKDPLADEEMAVDGMLLMPYEALMARIDGSEIYPLNGMVMALEQPKYTGIAVLNRAPVSNVYRVVAEGCRVKRYAGYGLPDRKGSIIGKKVAVYPNSAVAPEMEFHKKLSEHRLYFFHRRDILCYVQ